MIKWMKNGTLALVMATLGLVVPTGCGNGDTAESVVPNVEALVFLRRPFVRAGGDHNVAGGNGQTIDYRRYQPGEEGENEGGVYVLRPPTPDGELINLTEQFEGVDVNGLDVSFDATRVLFSMRTNDTRHYQIYEATLDGADVRQLTFGDWDSSQPQYVAGNRVAFITNRPYTEMGRRADEYNHSRGVGQIAMMDLDLGEASVLLCPQNLSNTVRPFTLSDGTIGYTRWEHFNNRNDAKLFRMNPDCTNMVALAGEFNKPGNSLFQASEIIGQPGRFVTSISSRMDTIQAGAPYLIDARSTTSTDRSCSSTCSRPPSPRSPLACRRVRLRRPAASAATATCATSVTSPTTSTSTSRAGRTVTSTRATSSRAPRPTSVSTSTTPTPASASRF